MSITNLAKWIERWPLKREILLCLKWVTSCYSQLFNFFEWHSE